jgi:hypothetical protein
MLNSKMVTVPQEFTRYVIPQNEDNEIITIFRYIVSFLSFNSSACGYNF